MEVPPEPFRLDPVLPPAPERGPLSDGEVRAAFERPVASPGLNEIFHAARRVLIVVSDATRATGADRFLPHLLARIRGAGRARPTFIVASGIHRQPTDPEIERILGPRITGRFPVIRHDPDEGSRLVEVGRTRAGTRVRVNSALLDCDRIVVTGAAGFHYYAGFSGGRKALVPGLASRDTITANHLRALRSDGSRHPDACAGRLRGNPVHRDMAEGAAMVAPHLVVNSVLRHDGEIERLFVGHWRRAHEAACRYVGSRRSLPLAPRELVVASAGGAPADINVIQSHKAFEAAIGALRPGGVFILVAECGDGAGHEDFMPWFRFDSERELIRALVARFQVYGQTALSWRRKADQCRLVLVSSLEPDVVRRLGAEPARDLEEAYRIARRFLAPGASGWLLPHGAKVVVKVPTTEDEP